MKSAYMALGAAFFVGSTVAAWALACGPAQVATVQGGCYPTQPVTNNPYVPNASLTSCLPWAEIDGKCTGTGDQNCGTNTGSLISHDYTWNGSGSCSCTASNPHSAPYNDAFDVHTNCNL